MLLTTKLISNSNLSCVTPFVIHLCSFTFKRDHHLCLMNTFLIYVCYHSVEAEQLAVAFMGKVVRVSQRQVHTVIMSVENKQDGIDNKGAEKSG